MLAHFSKFPGLATITANKNQTTCKHLRPGLEGWCNNSFVCFLSVTQYEQHRSGARAAKATEEIYLDRQRRTEQACPSCFKGYQNSCSNQKLVWERRKGKSTTARLH
eukprot:2344506-Amphidinium_carterae.1